MDSRIFLLQSDNSLLRMNEQPYESEGLLQELLATHSDLLAGDQIDAGTPRQWLFISREVGIPNEEGGSDRWSGDHLFLDQDAIPTFVETKRSSDTRTRREVVAQMLDYAANATTYWPVSRMRELYAQSCAELGQGPEEQFREQFDEEIDAEHFWAQAEENLRTGRVRLLFVADRIPTELRRIVEFLNGQMNPAEVLALEVKQYVGLTGDGHLRTLVPRIIGQTEVIREKKKTGLSSGKRRELVAVEDFSALPEVQEYRSAIDRLLQLGESSQFEVRPHATLAGNQVHFHVPGNEHEVFAIDTGRSCFWINFSSDERTSDPILKREIKSLLLPAFPKRKKQVEANENFLGLPFDQVATEAGLKATEQVVALVERAVFEDRASLASATEGGS